MTITSTGYERAINYARLGEMLAHAGSEYSVFGQDAFVLNAGVGAREVTVQPGRAYGHGIIDVSDEVVTLTGAPVASGNRWDMLALRRSWSSPAESTLVLIQGTAAKSIPARSVDPGEEDDQPLFLVRFSAGMTAAQEKVDLRCWGGSGGGLVARDVLARDYMTRIGTRVRIQGISWILGYDGVTPAWVPDGVYVGNAAPPYVEGLGWIKVP